MTKLGDWCLSSALARFWESLVGGLTVILCVVVDVSKRGGWSGIGQGGFGLCEAVEDWEEGRGGVCCLFVCIREGRVPAFVGDGWFY